MDGAKAMTQQTEIDRGRIWTGWRLARWGVIAAVLATPLVAMRFTGEVDWDAADFLFAGVLLGGAGLVFELAAWKVRDTGLRVAIGIVLLAAVLLLWADAAVGLF
jgi:hypothetical protein